MKAASRKRQVVVITDSRDAHLPFVQAHLDDPMVVIDPKKYSDGKTLTFTINGDKNLVTYDGLPLDNVTGIWYRKPMAIEQAQLSVNKEFQEYAFIQLQMHHTLLLTSFPNARWISNYYSLLQADDKTLQLTTASKLGFNVPKTLFTSDSSAAKAFIDHYGRVIMKTLGTLQIEHKGAQQVLYASIVDKEETLNLANLRITPLIFQELVEPGYDLRVTVVGDKVFPAKIRNTQTGVSDKVRDWRVGQHENKVIIEEYKKLPKDVAELCVKHVKTLGLNFGAIDLVVDKNGKIWFIENNSNGQWAFVEKETGQPIGKAIAEFLTQDKVG